MKHAAMAVLLIPFATLIGSSVRAEGNEVKQGVYEYAVEASELGFDDACARLAETISTSEFQFVASIDAGTPEECPYQSRIFVVYDSTFADALIEVNGFTGPFAVTDRINVFEDERGTHISYVNPGSIVRTILLDHENASTMAHAHRLKLRALIHGAVDAPVSEFAYGKTRKKGYIGRTMGVMAGGSYDGKVKRIAAAESMSFVDAVAKLEASMKTSAGKWDLLHAYTLVLPDREIAIIGSASPQMDRKSFSIVKAGADKRRKKFECPGIAHAGAYPVEMVVARDSEGAIGIYMPQMMYRMKMYFEDAGKWAFTKNMGMPGSLEGELKKQIRAALPEGDG